MALGSQVRLLQTGNGPGDRRSVFELQPGNQSLIVIIEVCPLINILSLREDLLLRIASVSPGCRENRLFRIQHKAIPGSFCVPCLVRCLCPDKNRSILESSDLLCIYDQDNLFPCGFAFS